jgi:hypothetical protein
MQVYKRTVTSLIGGVILSVFGGIVAWVVLQYWVVRNSVIAYAGGAAVFVLFALLQVLGESIYFELEGGELRYFKRGKLIHDFKLSEYSLRYSMRTQSGLLGSSTIALYFKREGEERETCIDAGPIGQRRFLRMWTAISAEAQPETLETKHKG